MESTPTTQQVYLQKHWDVLAGIAWREFTAHGRGALIVQNSADPNEEAIFVPLEMLTNNLLGHEYAEFVRKYDPRREVVIIFLGVTGSVSAYKGNVPCRATPPEAYRRMDSILFGKW